MGLLKKYSKTEKIIFEIALALILGTFASLFFYPAISPLYGDYSYQSATSDTYFFMHAGNMMLDGKIPYIDFYDHKGIYLFLYYELGMSMGGKIGVFFMSVLLDSIIAYSLIFMGKCIQGDEVSYLTISGIFLLILGVGGLGSQVGSVSLPLTGFALGMYTKALKNQDKADKYFLIGSFLGGLQVGFAFNVRASDAFVCFSLYIFYFIYSLKYKTKLNLLWNAIMALSGFIITCGIAFLICYLGGYFSEMFELNFIINSKYALTSDATSLMMIVIYSILSVIVIILSLLLYKQNKKDESIFIVATSIPVLIFNIIIAKYIHYIQSLLPLALCVVLIFYQNYDFKNRLVVNRINSFSFSIVGTLIGLVFVTSYYVMPYEESTSDLVSKDRDQAVISFIEDNLPNVETIEDNEVYLLDVNPMLLNYFEDNDIQIDCKYQAYQSWQSQVNDEVEKGVLEYLETYQPKYVVAKISEEDTSSNEELDISPLSYLTYISSHYTVIAKEENCSLAIYQIN